MMVKAKHAMGLMMARLSVCLFCSVSTLASIVVVNFDRLAPAGTDEQ